MEQKEAGGRLRLLVLCLLLLISHSILIMVLAGPLLRKQWSQDHLLFAQMSTRTVVEAYDSYYASGYYKFREIVSQVMRMNPNLRGLCLYDVEGRLLFDSQEFDRGRGARPEAAVDQELLMAIRSLEISCRLVGDQGRGRPIEIVVPHLEDWGRHRVSVRYLFSYGTWEDRKLSLLLRLALAGLITLAVWSGLILIGYRLAPASASAAEAKGGPRKLRP